MNHNNSDPTKLSWLEAEALRHLRLMDDKARGEMSRILAAFAQAHPARSSRPALCLVESATGGAK